MSKLDAIQERVGSAKGNLPATENFAVLVSGYGQDAKGRDTIKGMRLDTGEDVEVVLRAYKGPALKAPRAEVKDFVATEGEISTHINALPDEMRKQLLKGMKAKTEPGGTVIVQRAYTEKDTGVVNAGWLQSAAKFREHASVAPNVMVRVDPPLYQKRGDQEFSSVTATVIAPQRAELVTSEDELKLALRTAFTGLDEVQGRAMVLLRISDGVTSKAIEYNLPVKKNPAHADDKTQPQYLVATPAQAVGVFMKSDEGKQVAGLVGDPDLKIEVIPGTKVQLGSQAKASYENRAAGLNQVNAAYRFVKTEVEDTGFTPSYMVLHTVGENAQVFSAAEPLSNKPPLYHPRDIATIHFRGRPTVALENREVTQTVPLEDSVASQEIPDDDEPFEVADVVAAGIPPEDTKPSAPRPRM